MKAVLKEKNYDEEILIEHFLWSSSRELNDCYIKIFSDGITLKDLNSLIKLEGEIRFYLDYLTDKLNVILSQLKNLEPFLSCFNSDNAFEYEAYRYDELKIKESNLSSIVIELEDIDNRVIGIIYEAENILDNKVFDDNVIEYIINNTSLTHLIYANNTYPIIKPRSLASQMFLCQFHLEKTPSFLTHRRRCNCFGCGYNENQIGYLRDYENISEEDAIYLLAEIYMIKIPNNPFSGSDVVNRYRSVLMSEEYMNILFSSIDRLKQRSLNDSKGIEELKWFDKHIDSIKRIKANIWDTSIKDMCNVKTKVFKIEMPKFDD